MYHGFPKTPQKLCPVGPMIKLLSLDWSQERAGIGGMLAGDLALAQQGDRPSVLLEVSTGVPSKKHISSLSRKFASSQESELDPATRHAGCSSVGRVRVVLRLGDNVK